ncbi:MAG: AAA family ATPase [Thermoplasmata archaeon]
MNKEFSFSFGSLGPVKKGKIVNNDITMIYGYPNTGKSFILRAMYASISMLDKYSYDTVVKSLSGEIKSIIEDQINMELSPYFTLINKIENVLTYIKNKNDIDNKQIKKIIEKISNSIDSSYPVEIIDDKINFKLNKELNINVGTNKLKNLLKDELKKYFYHIIGSKKVDKLSINGFSVINEIDKTFKGLRLSQESTSINLKAVSSLMGVIYNDIPNLQLDELYYSINNINDQSMNIKIDVNISLNIPSFKNKRYSSLLLDVESYTTNTIEKIVQKISKKSTYKEDDFFRNHILKKINIELANNIADSLAVTLVEHARNVMENISDICDVKFIPFGRTPLLQETFNLSQYTPTYNFIYENYKKWVLTGAQQISDKSDDLNTKIFFIPLQGSLSYNPKKLELKYTDSNNNEISIDYASAMANEVAGIYLPSMTMGKKGILIIEEPESQLHPSVQIIMSMVILYLGLKGTRVIFSTHSDLFGMVMYYLHELKPSKDQILKLIEMFIDPEVYKKNKELVTSFADQLETGVKNIKIDVYYINHSNKKVNLVDLNKFGKEIPGITSNVIDKIIEWVDDVSNNLHM